MLMNFDSTTVQWSQRMLEYMRRPVIQQDWNLIQFVMWENDTKDKEEQPVPFLAGRVSNIQSGHFAECYFGWKLALIQP